MAQWLGVLAVLPEDPTRSDSQHPLGDTQLAGTLVSRHHKAQKWCTDIIVGKAAQKISKNNLGGKRPHLAFSRAVLAFTKQLSP